jgi:hypothetical protein
MRVNISPSNLEAIASMKKPGIGLKPKAITFLFRIILSKAVMR